VDDAFRNKHWYVGQALAMLDSTHWQAGQPSSPSRLIGTTRTPQTKLRQLIITWDMVEKTFLPAPVTRQQDTPSWRLACRLSRSNASGCLEIWLDEQLCLSL
jgi:hypothetical protein